MTNKGAGANDLQNSKVWERARGMSGSLDEDIRRTVDEAINSGDVLHIPEASKRLAAAHAKLGLDQAAIAQLVLKAAVRARVPLEMGATRQGQAGKRNGTS